MANIPPIQFKRSSVTTSEPTADELLEGEFALNLADKKIFTKDHNGNVVSIGGAGGLGTFLEETLPLTGGVGTTVADMTLYQDLRVYINGIRVNDDWYTLTGSTFTFVSEVADTDTIIIDARLI